jgi:hypothetical protein
MRLIKHRQIAAAEQAAKKEAKLRVRQLINRELLNDADQQNYTDIHRAEMLNIAKLLS